VLASNKVKDMQLLANVSALPVIWRS